MSNFWQKLKQPIIALAPMEGITDSAMRQMAISQGADLVYTEFISSDALFYNARTALSKMDYDKNEQPIICQIFGHDLESFEKAAQIIEQKGFAGIDINLGCPARKVVNHGSGVALLRNPEYARQLVQAVLENTQLPVSIKVRSSIRKEAKEVAPGCPDRYTALDLVKAISDLPVSAIMIHGRSFESGFDGQIDVDMIKQVKKEFKGIVLANGGVFTPEQAQEMLKQTGADGLGIGRGIKGKPWLIKQIKHLLTAGKYEQPNWPEIRKLIIDHARLAEKTKGQRGLLELRKHYAWYIKGIKGAAELRAQLVRVETVDQLQKVLPLEV
ncbi:MAG: tRNA-dihydrouridine synthase [bacterium]